VEKAVESQAAVIGINNRDLGSLTVSLQTTRRLLPGIPENVIRVSESGITSREDIDDLRSLGVNAFLMGSALLHSNDPGRFLQNLLAPGGERKGGVVE
jgi:indole-3-glycerol phosphate synthase